LPAGTQPSIRRKLSLRLKPMLHTSVAVKAELANKRIDQRVVDVLARETHA